jgi:hypothetical protein
MGFALRALEGVTASSRRSLMLLAPAGSELPGTLTETRFDRTSHEDLLSKMQRFRGATYFKDGAIPADALDSEGRHCLESDHNSWHVLAVTSSGEVCGCSRYSTYRPSVEFKNMAVGKSALAQSDQWGSKLRAAIERERLAAEKADGDFVEVGGWAIAEDLRRTTEALRIALATYALGHHLGACVGVTTATVRHQSANVLRKIGGQPLMADSTELPRYFDPQYECEMEILRFELAAPNPKFVPWIEQMSREMATMPVVSARAEYQHHSAREQSTFEELGAAIRLACSFQFS